LFTRAHFEIVQFDLKTLILNLLNAYQNYVTLIYKNALTVAVETLFRVWY